MMTNRPVMVLADPDYCYGTGALTLRVHHIDYSNPTHYDGEPWYPVRGVQLGHGGREFGTRDVLVRGRRIPRFGSGSAA